MQYLCLVYAEPEAFDAMSPAEGKALVRESLDHDDILRSKGHFVHANALQPVTTATTIRVRNGRMSTTDGPFAETKEHLCGFILIEAADLDEAIRLGAGIPMARVGSIEIRPIMELSRD
jgi:hypothetical protein